MGEGAVAFGRGVKATCMCSLPPRSRLHDSPAQGKRPTDTVLSGHREGCRVELTEQTKTPSE